MKKLWLLSDMPLVRLSVWTRHHTRVQRHVDTHVAIVCIAETGEEEASLQSMQGRLAADDTASSQPGRLYKYKRWLGHWKPEYDLIRTETELALHVSTSSWTDQHMLITGRSHVEMGTQCM